MVKRLEVIVREMSHTTLLWNIIHTNAPIVKGKDAPSVALPGFHTT